MPRYRIEIDYEHDNEWSVGAMPAVPVPRGEACTNEEFIGVLERVLALYKAEFGHRHGAPCVRYPSRSESES
jgi:hypothetical protein